MAVRTKEEILNIIKDKFSGDTGDETLGFIEDINDTFDNYDNRLKDTTNWEEKYKQNDAEWRQKYKDRFFNGGGSGEDDFIEPDTTPKDKPKTFEELFKEG